MISLIWGIGIVIFFTSMGREIDERYEVSEESIPEKFSWKWKYIWFLFLSFLVGKVIQGKRKNFENSDPSFQISSYEEIISTNLMNPNQVTNLVSRILIQEDGVGSS